tara:strand:+ start:6043 stop:6201 length:159 start_codon:yes stop_codon:yes gene_type:complete
MKLTSSKRGEWPNGVHWTPGECREIDVPKGVDVPAWLTPAKAKKTAKAKGAE